MCPALERLAEPYALRRALPLCVCEGAGPDELHLQALWQNDALRPRDLALPDGTPVEVLSTGRWNRSAGPDFKDALISAGGLLRRGDVELHVCPGDWDTHGHAADPAYGALVLHVTWHEGAPARTLPPGVPTLALRPFAEREGPFDFSRLNLSNAPYGDDATAPRPCCQRLAEEVGGLERLLSAAGHFRLLFQSEGLFRRAGFGRRLPGVLCRPSCRNGLWPKRHAFPSARGGSPLLTYRDIPFP